MPTLILASTSGYRRALLARLWPALAWQAPGTDETPRPGEPPGALVRRLAAAKAAAVAQRHPGAVVVGSDQVAELDGLTLGKPGDRAAARAQLAACSGREVVFHTAVCVCAPGQPDGEAVDLTRVRFRTLDAASIERYLDLEPAFDCAGGFKVEALGIALFERVDSADPTALVGLPLIATARLLRAVGVDPLAPAAGD
jgi:septum formation protein